MKLAFVNFYSGLAERGGETFADSLATSLSSKYDVSLFHAGKISPKPYSQVSKNLNFNPNHPHSRLPTTHILKRLFLDYFSLKILTFTIKIIPDLIKLKPDYIYPLNSGWEIFLLTLASRYIGTKVIVGGHSGPGWNDRVNLLFHPDIFVALTKTQSLWANKATIWNNQKIVVIPNGVDLKKFTPKGQKTVLSLKSPIILAVGATTKSKRLEETIKAVSKMKDASLLICGTGPQNSEIDQLGKSLLKDRFERKVVSQSDMPSLYRSADAFTLCSDRSEAFGIVYLEALATNLPCIATDDESRREILGEAGIYVSNPTDAEEYAEKLSTALKQKESEKYLSRAKKYSWDAVAKMYEKNLDK